MWSSYHSRPFQTERQSRRTCPASLVARMTKSEKSARIGAFLDRLHADMATGVVSVDEASIEFGAGEPQCITARQGVTQLDGEAALPLVAVALLQNAGELTLDTQAVVRRRAGQAAPWSDWRQRLMDALRDAEVAFPGEGAASPDPDGTVTDRSTMPLLPTGELVVTAVAVDAAGTVETWARLLGSGLVVLNSDSVGGVVVARGRTIVDALAVDNAAEAQAGRAALRTLTSAEQGTLTAVPLDDNILAAVPMLWRHPAVLNGVDRRLLDVDGVFATAAEVGGDGALEVSSADGDMVLLIRGGRPLLAYDARGPVTLTEFWSFLATTKATVTLRLPKHSGRFGDPTAMLAGAALPEHVQDTEGDGTRGGSRPHLGDCPTVAEPFREPAEGALEQLAPCSTETAVREPQHTRGARRATDPWYPVVVEDDESLPPAPTDPLGDLRHDLAQIAEDLGGQGREVLRRIQSATTRAEMAEIPDQVARMVAHPAFRQLRERVVDEMRTRLAAS